MRKIASPMDLVTELNSLESEILSNGLPSREVLARKLQDLSSRVAKDDQMLNNYLNPEVVHEGGEIGFELGLPSVIWADNEGEAKKWIDKSVSNLKALKGRL